MFAARNMMFAGSFSPLSLAPALWLSDTGSDVAQWDDLSGNGRHATQATAANQPAIVTGALNGRQVRRFDGVNDWLSIASTFQPFDTSWHVFTVYKPSLINSSWQSLMVQGSPTGLAGQRKFTLIVNGGYGAPINTMSAFFDEGGTHYAYKNTLTAGSAYLHSIQRDSSIVVFRENGSVGTVVGTLFDSAGTWPLLIGKFRDSNPYPLNGDIAEILVFPTALSTADRQAVENYLNNKWAIY